MNRRSWFVAGGIAVLIAILVILFATSGGGGKANGKGSGSATAVSVVDPTIAAPPKPGVPVVTPDTPRLPEGSDTVVLPDGTRMYKQGNMMVRDHRTPSGSGSDVPFQFPVQADRAPKDPNKHKMKPEVIGSLRPGLTDAVAACAHDVPADGRGPHPKVAATLMLAVSKEHVTVTGSTIDLPDVIGASVEPTKQCLAEKLSQLTTTAPGEPDLVDYSITVQVPIR